MEDEIRCHYSLISRLDQLGFIMKYLERNPQMGMRWESRDDERACVPLDVAAREASIKGSLLDRVASLEHRLFQLCLEMESGSNNSWSQRSQNQLYSSFPIFRYQNEGRKQPESSVHVINNQSVSNGKSDEIGEDKQKQKQMKKKKTKTRKIKREDKTGKSRNKESSVGSGSGSNWPRFRILGC